MKCLSAPLLLTSSDNLNGTVQPNLESLSPCRSGVAEQHKSEPDDGRALCSQEPGAGRCWSLFVSLDTFLLVF